MYPHHSLGAGVGIDLGISVGVGVLLPHCCCWLLMNCCYCNSRWGGKQDAMTKVQHCCRAGGGLQTTQLNTSNLLCQ